MFLDENLPEVKNNPEIFGYQVQVDENENVVYEEKRLLINAISKSFEEIEAFIHNLNGLFIPAHLNRSKNSIYSQLGFLPDKLNADAVEISRATTVEQFIEGHPEVKSFSVIRNSDAHYPEDIGTAFTLFYIEEASFCEIKQALKKENGRKIIIE